MEGAATTTATVLSTITSIVTSIISVLGDVLTFIVGNPFMLVAILMPIAYVFIPKALGLIKRAFGKKKI